MGMNLDIEVQKQGDVSVTVIVKGDVTIQTSPQLQKALAPCFNEQVQEIRVDLSGVGFMDSSGIATLVEGLQWSRASGCNFVLTGLADTVRDVFALAKLDTVFEIEGSGAGE